jgi:hypothetical protein
MILPMSAAEVDERTARWLRKRHPTWSDDKIGRLITRSRVIDDHPNWQDEQVDAETAQRRADRREIS